MRSEANFEAAEQPIEAGFKTATNEWLMECIALSADGIITEPIMMTPEVAKAILAANPDNRPLTTKSNQITLDIANGRWVFNGESVIISRCGQLNDGQHRLAAIVKAGKPVPMMVTFGVDRSSRLSVDQGIARHAGHYLAMAGEKNGNLTAATTRLIQSYEAGDGTALVSNRYMSNNAVFDRAMSDPAIDDAVQFVRANEAFLRGIVPPRVLGALFYIFSRVHPADATTFMEQVVRGENLVRGDPAFAVRQALMTIRGRAAPPLMEVIMRGWVAFRERKPLLLAKRLGFFPPVV